MGILNTANMIRKAQQARAKMQDVSAAGVSKNGFLAILLDGLNTLPEAELSDEFFEEKEFEGMNESNKKSVKNKIQEMIVEAHKDARKNLEKKLTENFDMESLSDMFSN